MSKARVHYGGLPHNFEFYLCLSLWPYFFDDCPFWYESATPHCTPQMPPPRLPGRHWKPPRRPRLPRLLQVATHSHSARSRMLMVLKGFWWIYYPLCLTPWVPETPWVHRRGRGRIFEWSDPGRHLTFNRMGQPGEGYGFVGGGLCFPP